MELSLVIGQIGAAAKPVYIDRQGFSRQAGDHRPSEVAMDKIEFKGDPIPLVQLSPFEKVFFAIMNGFSYGLGYLVGFLRYRVFKNMNLFSVLSSMSRGLSAAAPLEEKADRGAGSLAKE
jgi:hypothetical protein